MQKKADFFENDDMEMESLFYFHITPTIFLLKTFYQFAVYYPAGDHCTLKNQS